MELRRHAVRFALALLVAGCGGSHKEAETPASQPAPAGDQSGYGVQSGSPPAPAATTAPSSLDQERYAEPPPPATLEQAEAELERARAELEVALGAPPADVAAESGKATSESRPPAAKRSARPATPPNCPNACRSLASLKRAAAAVCRLAGDPSARCSHARTLVDDNERRVASCGCGEDGD